MRVLIPALLGLAMTGVVPAFAQTTAPGTDTTSPAVASSGSAGGAATGGTTDVGQTKPPGAAVGDGLGTRPDLDQKSRQLDQKINQGICVGCK